MSCNPFACFRRGRKSRKQRESPLKKRKTYKPDFEVLELRQPAAETLGMAISHFALASSALGVLDLVGRLESGQSESKKSTVSDAGRSAISASRLLELVPAKTDSSFTTAAQTDTKQPENSSIIVAAPPAQDPLSASSAFTAVNAFAGFSEDPFALFLGPPGIPAKVAASQGGASVQDVGANIA